MRTILCLMGVHKWSVKTLKNEDLYGINRTKKEFHLCKCCGKRIEKKYQFNQDRNEWQLTSVK